MVLWKAFGSMRGEQKDGENYVMRIFVIFTLHQIMSIWSSQRGWYVRGNSTHAETTNGCI